MTKKQSNRKIELLAPAGNFEIFKEVITSGADAVYFGGKILNMRMHRKDFNFSNDEILEAISIAKRLGKKVYITVNNLFSQEDLQDAKDYLLFLNQAKPDGLIIQDMSILGLVNELNIDLELHSSVMMNVHNLDMINELQHKGITRVVTSREMSLETIKEMSSRTSMEFEYFTHGDMCVAHGSQCHYSSLIFGKSSNRGLCMKPCRWGFSVKKDGFVFDTSFPLAVKDMSMYEHIGDLIESGVISFKIEGRMRSAEYLIKLINIYRDSIDRYLKDPVNFDTKKDLDFLIENRKRDLSTGFSFGNLGLENINNRYEGTGVFYSHGRVFSKPVIERDIRPARITEIKEFLSSSYKEEPVDNPKLSVKVDTLEQAMIAIEENVDYIYLSGEVFLPNTPFAKEEILKITKEKRNSKIYLGFPTMTTNEDLDYLEILISEVASHVDGFLVTNLGLISRLKKYNKDMISDYSLNIYNHKSAEFYKNQGISRGTLSIEAPLKDISSVLNASTLDMEVIVAGTPTVMYLEHDLYENVLVKDKLREEHNRYVSDEILVLVDDNGTERPVYKDSYGRNHLVTYKELCHMHILKELYLSGAKVFRIEGAHYNKEDFKTVISSYKKALTNFDNVDAIFKSMDDKLSVAGYTLGSIDY